MQRSSDLPISRRSLLQRLGTGLGVVGLANLLKETGPLAADVAKAVKPLAPKIPHFQPKAKRIIHLFMNGGPSQVDTFDPKPALEKYHGQKAPPSIKIERNSTNLMRSPYKFGKYGKSGIEVSE